MKLLDLGKFTLQKTQPTLANIALRLLNTLLRSLIPQPESFFSCNAESENIFFKIRTGIYRTNRFYTAIKSST